MHNCCRRSPHKETIDINTYNRSYGTRGNFTKNDQLQGRELMYRRKKEAIVVFGFSIWGTPFEEFKDFLKENTEPASIQMSMF